MSERKKPSPNQYVIDFTSRARDEYRRIRAAVIAAVGRNLAAKCFLELVHRFENEREGLWMTYDAIAEELLCHRTTAIRLRTALENALLLTVTPSSNAGGGDSLNEYRLNWAGIDAATVRTIAHAHGATVVRTQSQPATAQSQPATAQSQPATAQSRIATALGTITPSDLTRNSGPVPEGRAETAEGFDSEEALASAADGERWRVSALRAGPFVREVPLLAEAALRRLVARPPTNWTGWGRALFAGLELSDLKPLRAIDWHLEQLSSAAPVCGPTEADLLLTMSAGAQALAIPERDVKRNRVAIFVTLVSRGEWRKVLVHLEDVRALLDRLAAQRGAYWLQEAEVRA